MSAEHGQLQQSGGRRGRSPGDKKSRRRSRRKETYSMYIYKVLKQVSVGGHHGRGAGAGKSPERAWMGFTPCTKAPAPLLWGHSSFQRPQGAAPCLS